MLSRWWNVCTQIYVVITVIVSSVQTVEVRLNLGQTENQGKVEVRKENQLSWGQVCDVHFTQLEADVVCRQLRYKYARVEKDVYKATLSDFVLENIHCDGDEEELGDCIDGDWKVNAGECKPHNHNYASVCCSNSPDFGEVRDNVFVSDCADSWLGAAETCEAKEAILADSTLYQSLLGSYDTSGREKYFWTRKYFTPWLWSNGCFKILNTSLVTRDFTLQNNSAHVCLQLCSIEGPTSFLLSGSTCRCLTESLQSSIIEVLPGFCNIKCVGNEDSYCGNVHKDVWSYYSIASEDDFFRIRDPDSNQLRQCAIIKNDKKFETQNCDMKRGFICGEVDANSSLKLIYFPEKYYNATMMESKQKCSTTDISTYLVGDRILTYTPIYSSIDNMWVNIMRTLSEVYQVDVHTDSARGSGRLKNLEPKFCLARKLSTTRNYYVDELSPCQDRYRYICSLDNGSDGTTIHNGSADETTGSTMFNHSYIITSKPGPSDTDLSVLHMDLHSTLTIVISVLCAVVLVALVIGLIFYWCRRSAKKGKGPFVSFMKTPDPISEPCDLPPNEYLAVSHNDETQEHIYNELEDPSKNVYNEVDNLLDKNDTSNYIKDEDLFKKPLPPEPIETGTEDNPEDQDLSNSLKEPVTMKRSYSSPKDLVKDGDVDDATCFKDPSYTYPYDKVLRSDHTNEEDNKDVADVSEVPEMSGDPELSDSPKVSLEPIVDVSTDTQSANPDSIQTVV